MNKKLKNILENFTENEITDNFITFLNGYDADIQPHDGCELGVDNYNGTPLNNDIKYCMPPGKINDIELYR